MAHASHHNSSSEKVGEQIAWEERHGSSEEAARELNYVRAHSDVKTFNAVYKSANSYIDKYNKHDHTNLPNLQLVDSKGAVVNDVKDAAGYKIGNTTYATDHVKNQTTVDKQDGATISTGGYDARFGAYTEKLVDDVKGNTILKKANGDYQNSDGHGNFATVDQNGNHKHIDYANGDQLDVNKDGADLIINRTTKDRQNKDGKAAENYTVRVHPDGSYEMTYKDSNGVEQHYKGTNYTDDQVKNNRFDENLDRFMNPENHAS